MGNDYVSEQNIDDFLEIHQESGNIVTENDIKLWTRCPYAYFHKRHMGLNKIPQSGIALESMIFQQARKALMHIRSPTGKLFYTDTRVGPQFKTLNELTKEDLPEYLAFSSPEAFGGAIFGRWMMMGDTFANRSIVFNFAEQKFTIGKELRTSCANYYRFVLDNGTPLPGYINKDTAVDVGGQKIRMTFPEIRPGMVIDDPTIWAFNAENQFDEKSRLEDSALVTLRILAFSQLVTQYQGYARIFGVKDEDVDDMSKHIITDKIRYRHFNASKACVTETNRTEKDIDTLNMIVDRFVNDTQKRAFIPNHKHCQGCGYNVLNENGNIVCDRVKKGIRTHVPERYFKKKNISIDTVDMNTTESRIVISIGEEEDKRPVILGEYRLRISSQDDSASSKYSGNIRGIGFEEMAIKEMDKHLQRLSDEKKRRIIHTIDFENDFRYAGQKSISDLISKLGYINFEKRYTPKQS